MLCAQYQEMKLIDQLNNYFNFDHNVYLLHQSVDVNCFVNPKRSGQMIPQSLYRFKEFNNNITGLESITIQSKNTFLVIVPETSNNNLNLLIRVKEIQRETQRQQMTLKMGMFFQHAIASAVDLLQLFEWSWKEKIISIFAGTYLHTDIGPTSTSERLNVFTFNPFGTMTVINVTGGSEAFDNYYLNQNINFQQHTLILAHEFHDGYHEDVIGSILRVMNSSFTIKEHFSYTTIFDNGTDIVPQTYAIIDSNADYLNTTNPMYSYPVETLNMIILVPEARPYPEFSVYLRTVTEDRFFTYFLITIAGIMLLLSIVRYMEQKKFIFFESVADVLNLLMNDNANINYRKLSWIELFLILPLTLVGFVFVNGIISHLQSHLTRPVLEPQIDTVDELYKSPFPVLVWDEIWQGTVRNVLENVTAHDWLDKVQINRDETELRNFNKSISYVLQQRKAEAYLRVQKQLNIRGYHICQTNVNKLYLSYLLHKEFPFVERFNEILNWIRDAGLLQRWVEQRYVKVEKRVLNFTRNRLESSVGTSDVVSFPIPIFIVYGWCVSTFVFVIEIFWKNIKCARILRRVLKRMRTA